jgi:hypothetical protein
MASKVKTGNRSTGKKAAPVVKGKGSLLKQKKEKKSIEKEGTPTKDEVKIEYFFFFLPCQRHSLRSLDLQLERKRAQLEAHSLNY